MGATLKLVRDTLEQRDRDLSADNDNDLPEDVLELVGANLRPDQTAICESFKRFNFLCCHRRMGKSYMLAAYLLDRAVESTTVNGNYGYFAATRGQTFNAVWTLLVMWAAKIPGAKVKEKTHEVFVPNRAGGRSRIVVEGLNHTKQRAAGWDGVVIDEAAEVHEYKWLSEIYPALYDKVRRGVDRKGRTNRFAIICGTPIGRNWFFRQYQKARMWAIGEPYRSVDPVTGLETFEARQDWTCTYLPASVTKFFSDEEVAAIKSDLGEEEWLREFELDWTASATGAILGADLRALRNAGAIGSFPHVEGLPVHTTWDIGLAKTVIWFFQIVGDKVRFIDAFSHSTEGLNWYFEVILPSRREKRGYMYGSHYLPHDAVASEILSGDMRLDYVKSVLKRLDMGEALIVERHDPRGEGLDAVRWLLKRSNIHEPLCETEVDNLAMVRRRLDPKTETLNQVVEDDNVHAMDSIRQAGYEIRRVLEAA